MTDKVLLNADLDAALAVVKAAGYVVLKEKSYRQAQERQRVAEALRKLEQEHNEHTRAWANKAFDEQRHLRDRCEYLYGLAARLGACDRQLRGPLTDEEVSLIDGSDGAERLTAGEFAAVLLSVGPICTCCDICADKASDRIFFALDKRGWAIVDERLVPGGGAVSDVDS